MRDPASRILVCAVMGIVPQREASLNKLKQRTCERDLRTSSEQEASALSWGVRMLPAAPVVRSMVDRMQEPASCPLLLDDWIALNSPCSGRCPIRRDQPEPSPQCWLIHGMPHSGIADGKAHLQVTPFGA
jgi:hypothetical protein